MTKMNKYKFMLKEIKLADKRQEKTKKELIKAVEVGSINASDALQKMALLNLELLNHYAHLFLELHEDVLDIYDKGELVTTLNTLGYNVRDFSEDYVDVYYNYLRLLYILGKCQCHGTNLKNMLQYINYVQDKTEEGVNYYPVFLVPFNKDNVDIRNLPREELNKIDENHTEYMDCEINPFINNNKESNENIVILARKLSLE